MNLKNPCKECLLKPSCSKTCLDYKTYRKNFPWIATIIVVSLALLLSITIAILINLLYKHYVIKLEISEFYYMAITILFSDTFMLLIIMKIIKLLEKGKNCATQRPM